MTITLTTKEELELWAEADQNTLQNPEPHEFVVQIPRQLGTGYVRDIEVHPDLSLKIFDYEYHDDVLIKIPDWDHPLQFAVLLSGRSVDEYGGQVGAGYTLISGCGVQQKMFIEHQKSRRIGVDIHMPPELLATFFPTEDGEIPPELSLLTKGDDWQTLLYQEITPIVQTVAQQIVNCPYQGLTKRMYLQAKVLELMTLQLVPILANQGKVQPSPRLKPETMSRIYHAREILLSHLENPPSLLELGKLVGVSNSTLKRAFPEIFGTTVFGFVTNKRMEWAEQLLRQDNSTVAEVANKVGYCNLGHFAAAFKRRFGITPSQCLMGKKVLSGS